jgi:DnaJ-domain-containing protein 1
MDLLKRLYNIARAEMPANGDMGRDNGRNDRGQRGRPEPSARADTSDSSNHEKRSNQDPVLAGYYANLELPYGADIVSVKKSWKRLMKQYHPDMHSKDAQKKKVADELCAELTRAYQELERVLTARS